MFLSIVTIRNFRSCKNVTLHLQEFNALIGYNNAGKSNCLKAIKWALSTNSKPCLEDYNDENLPITVELTFTEVTSSLIDENSPIKKKIEPFLQGEILKIKKTANNAQDRSVHYEIFDSNSASWKNNVTGINNALQPILPHVIHIEAMENAVEDSTKIKSGTTFSSLMDYFKEIWFPELDSTLHSELEKLNEKLNYQGAERSKSFKNFDDEFNKVLSAFFPGIKAHIDLPVPTTDELLKNLTLRLEENDQLSRNVNLYGQGSQRCLQMALVKFLSESIVDKKILKNCILMIDEPELYLHPIMIDTIRTALIKISRNKNFQILVTTHSPLMLDNEYTFMKAIIVRKNANGTYVSTKTGSDCAKIKSQLLQEVATFENLGYALFAERIVLLEGESEKAVVPTSAINEVKSRVKTNKLAFVKVGGCTKLITYKEIFEKRGIPCYITADLDFIKGFFKHTEFRSVLEEVKRKFTELKNKHTEIQLDKESWPMKNQKLTAEKCWELFSQEYPKLVNRIHSRFLEKDIWIWTSGALESVIHTKSSNKVGSAYALRSNLQNTTKTSTELNPQIYEWINWITKDL